MAGGGAITIKSNPRPARWATHKLQNNNTKEVLPLLWWFWASCQASQPGDLTKGLGIPRESDLEGQQDLIIGLPQGWEKQRFYCWRAQTKFACTKTQGKGSVILQETEPDLTASVTGFPVEVRVGRGSPQVWGHRQQQSWKVPLGVSPFGGRH